MAGSSYSRNACIVGFQSCHSNEELAQHRTGQLLDSGLSQTIPSKALQPVSPGSKTVSWGNVTL